MRAGQVVAILVAASAGGCGSHGRPPDTETSTTPEHATTGATASPKHLGPVGVTPATHRLLPPLRRCKLPPEAANGGLIHAAVGGGATCTTARDVLIPVSHWSGRRCWRACPHDVRMAHGFSCTTYKIGEADWSVNCWKARKIVHTSLAE
jgi:hypothetical protein